MLKIGLIGYGKAGQAVANVLQADPELELAWIARRTGQESTPRADAPPPPSSGSTGSPTPTGWTATRSMR